MGGEGAETYLRLLAEAQLRTVTRRADPDVAAAARRSDVNAGLDRVQRAGAVLLAAGLVTRDSVTRIADELQVAVALRSPHLAPTASWPAHGTAGDQPWIRAWAR